jgi:hypothetical protein
MESIKLYVEIDNSQMPRYALLLICFRRHLSITLRRRILTAFEESCRNTGGEGAPDRRKPWPIMVLNGRLRNVSLNT